MYYDINKIDSDKKFNIQIAERGFGQTYYLRNKAIHMLQSYAAMTDNQGRPKLDQAIEIVLNLLEEQDNRIKELESDNYECNNIIDRYIEELEFKDKLIDAMLEVIEECRANDCLYSDEIDLSQIAGTEQIKQYFENLAKESGEIDED